jgi:hypothetical protein
MIEKTWHHDARTGPLLYPRLRDKASSIIASISLSQVIRTKLSKKAFDCHFTFDIRHIAV